MGVRESLLKFVKDKLEKEEDENIHFLSSLPLFDSLSTSQVTKLFSIMHVRTYQNEEVIVRQGDPGVGLYIVRKGTVDVFYESDDTMTRKRVSVLSEGDVLGEISLLTEAPRSATLISDGDATLYGLFKSDLFDLIESDYKLGFMFILRISQIISSRFHSVRSNDS